MRLLYDWQVRDELTRANEEQEALGQARERVVAEHSQRIGELEREREDLRNEMQTLRDTIATKKVTTGSVNPPAASTHRQRQPAGRAPAGHRQLMCCGRRADADAAHDTVV